MNDEKVDELLDEVRRQNNWLKFQNSERIRSILDDLGKDDQLIFHHTDGESSVREVAAKTSYDSNTPVQNRMREWRAQGLVFKNTRGKWEHLAPMEAFGLEPPEPQNGGENDEE